MNESEIVAEAKEFWRHKQELNRKLKELISKMNMWEFLEYEEWKDSERRKN